jgi:glucuronosyltransferase
LRQLFILQGIAEHFDCVLISYTTFGAVKWIDDMTSKYDKEICLYFLSVSEFEFLSFSQSPYSYVPAPFLKYTDKMTFSERFMNTICFQFENFAYALYHLPSQRKLYKKYFPNAKKSFDEIYKNSAIIFLNNHVSASSARPYLPSMIEIGGIHVEPAKPLPKDIQVFLDSAQNGAILFSMGSMIQAVNWPIEKREAFVKAFAKLNLKVLWKYENETLPNKPDNVMINPWIPQRDILAHPNIKLFITHGGLLGTTEALVEGVAVLGIPIFGDQKMNMAKAVAREYGQQLFFDDVTEENVSNVLKELLSNPKYAENAKIISSRFTDRPMTQQETVVYWTEYALRHNGAPHLKAAGNSLSFFEFHLIDVYLTLCLIGIFVLFIQFLLLKIILKKIFGFGQKTQKLKKK